MEAALKPDPAPLEPYLPRAIGGGEPLDRGRLLAAPLRSAPKPAILEAPVTKLRGAGPKLSAAAAEIGIGSLGDLLRHLPHSYRDRADPVGIGELKLGEEATIEVEVRGSKLRPTRRRRLTILEAEIVDETGGAKAVWFNRAWLADRLQPGTRLLLRGKLEKRGFTVAEHELLDSRASSAPAGLHTLGIVPVHPASDRLRPQRIREWAWQAVGQRGTRSSPCRLPCGPSSACRRRPTRWSPRTSPPTATRPRPLANGSPSRSSSSTRRRWLRDAGGGSSPAAGRSCHRPGTGSAAG